MGACTIAIHGAARVRVSGYKLGFLHQGQLTICVVAGALRSLLCLQTVTSLQDAQEARGYQARLISDRSHQAKLPGPWEIEGGCPAFWVHLQPANAQSVDCMLVLDRGRGKT